MANSDKNIVITPNISSSTDDPKIIFTGADSSTCCTITIKAYPENSGTLSIEGSAGQLFSTTNCLTGTIFSVNDVSGLPLLTANNTTGDISLKRLIFDNALCNLAIGCQSFFCNTIGTHNTAIGFSSLRSNTTGERTTAIGTQALYSNTIGGCHVAIGYQALCTNTTGFCNIAIGNESLRENTIGNSNTAIGMYALACNTCACWNLAIGNEALRRNTTGSGNIGIGFSSLAYNTIGTCNTAVGYQALSTNTSGDQNTAFGAKTLWVNTTGAYNTAIGHTSMTCNTTGVNNTAVGYQALYSNTIGTQNTAIGTNTLAANTTGGYNIAIGTNALTSNLTGIENIGIGFEALRQNQSSNNISIGTCSLRGNTTGAANTAIGVCSLFSNTTGIQNTALGQQSLCSNTIGNCNIAVGAWSLFANTTGNSNIGIGFFSGCTTTIGTNNIILGHCAIASSASVSNEITLGNASITSLRIPGLTSGRTTGDVMYYDGTKIAFCTPAAAGAAASFTGGAVACVTCFTCNLNATTLSTGALRITGGAAISCDLLLGGCVSFLDTSTVRVPKVTFSCGDAHVDTYLCIQQGGAETYCMYSGSITVLGAGSLERGGLRLPNSCYYYDYTVSPTCARYINCATAFLELSAASSQQIVSEIGTGDYTIEMSYRHGARDLGQSPWGTETYSKWFGDPTYTTGSACQGWTCQPLISFGDRTRSLCAYCCYKWTINCMRTIDAGYTYSSRYPAISEFKFMMNTVTDPATGVIVCSNTAAFNNSLIENKFMIDGKPETYQSLYPTLAVPADGITAAQPAIVCFIFPTAKTFNSYDWAGAGSPGWGDPICWTVEASNDGTNWTNLSTVACYQPTLIDANAMGCSFKGGFALTTCNAATSTANMPYIGFCGAANDPAANNRLNFGFNGVSVISGQPSYMCNTKWCNINAFNGWFYIIIQRNSGCTRMYHGSQSGSASQIGGAYTCWVDSTPYCTTNIRFGIDPLTSVGFTGNLDEIRISKVARYACIPAGTANPYPLSGGAFCNDVNTILLLHLDKMEYQGTPLVGQVLSTYYPDDVSCYAGATVGGFNTNIGHKCNQQYWGYQALNSLTTGCYNLAIGFQALKSLTTGSYNSAIGFQALANAGTDLHGSYNTAIGYLALTNTTTGEKNTAVGFRSMTSNTTGEYNAAIGTDSLSSNVSGVENVALGHNSLFKNYSGSGLVAAGFKSLFSNTTGNFNTGVGTFNLCNNTYGSYNVAMGYQSLFCQKTNCYNIGIGYQAGYSNLTGCGNIMIGYKAGFCIGNSPNSPLSDKNIAIGFCAAASTAQNSTVKDLIAIGYEALRSANPTSLQTQDATNSIAIGSRALWQGGIDNIAIGTCALANERYWIQGCRHIAIGHCAFEKLGADAGTNLADIAIGHEAGACLYCGSNSIAIGCRALYSAAANLDGYATNTVAIGQCSQYNNLFTQRNISIGSFSLYNNTCGGDNTAIGYNALCSNTTGCCNIAIGCDAGKSILTANSNTAIGYGALCLLTAGNNNLAIGQFALMCMAAVNDNVGIGNSALCKNIGHGSTAIGGGALGSALCGGLIGVGQGAGGYITCGYNIISIGVDAGPTSHATNGHGYTSIAIGCKALRSNYGNNNIAIGYMAITENTTGNMNLVIGQSANMNAAGNCNIYIGNSAATYFGYNRQACGVVPTGNLSIGNCAMAGAANAFSGLDTGSYNTVIGHFAMFRNSTGCYNTGVGECVLYNTISGYGSNVAFGTCSMFNNTTGTSNTAMGFNSLMCNTIGGDNTAIGRGVMYKNTEGSSNVAIGYASLNCNTTGSHNTAIGYNALLSNTTGNYNIGIGRFAVANNTIGEHLLGIGFEALVNNTTGCYNIAIGTCSLRGNTIGSCNTAIGYCALYANSTGITNTAIGYFAGCTITTGTNNSLIGYLAQASSATATNQITLGNTAITCVRIPSTSAVLEHSGTIAAGTTTTATSGIGYMGLPQNSQATAYTLVIGDVGKHIYVTTTATITIPANGTVAYPIGTVINLIAGTGVTITVAITTDTLYLGGTGTTGSRTVAAFGMATLVKLTSTTWIIGGTGVT